MFVISLQDCLQKSQIILSDGIRTPSFRGAHKKKKNEEWNRKKKELGYK